MLPETEPAAATPNPQPPAPPSASGAPAVPSQPSSLGPRRLPALGQLLVNDGVISQRQLDLALAVEAREEAGEAARLGGDELAISDRPGPAANDVGPPPAKGIVRLPTLRGSWTVTPAPDGSADVIYLVHSEPGGSVPAFLVRGALVDSGRDVVLDVLEWAAAHP